ncbi:MAG: JAB domain-containing protein [Candidatus Eisenbacteria bacterium]
MITRRMVKTGTIVGIDVVDHVIVGDGTFVSTKERGYL